MQAKTTLLLLVSLFLWSGCGDYSNEILKDDLAFLKAIPPKASLEIRIAENQKRDLGGTEGTLGLRSDALLSDTASWYLFTLVVSQGVNRYVFGFIDLVDLITAYPPAARENDVRYWGPWASTETPNTDWRFIMERDPQIKMFGFSLEVNAKANRHTSSYPDDWASCVSGKISPSGEGSGRGLGWLNVDLEICGCAEGTGERGTASVGFDTLPDADNPEGKTYLTIQFFDFVSKRMLEKRPDPNPLNALYDYKEHGDFSGEFRLEVSADLHKDTNPFLDAEEQIELYTRWDTTKAGRADIRIFGGDLGPEVILGQECWDSDKKRVYYEDSVNFAPKEGSPKNCVLDPIPFE